MSDAVLMQKWGQAQQEFVTPPGVCLNALDVFNEGGGCEYLDPNSSQARAAVNVWPCKQRVISEQGVIVDGHNVLHCGSRTGYCVGWVSGGDIVLAAGSLGDEDASYEMANVILDNLGISHAR